MVDGALDILIALLKGECIGCIDNYMGVKINNMRIWRNLERKYSRTRGPAIIEFWDSLIQDLEIQGETWYQNGKEHRIDRPSRIEYYKTGQIKLEAWSVHGIRDNKNIPSIISYHRNGTKHIEIWYLHNSVTRSPLPSYIEYSETGKILYENS